MSSRHVWAEPFTVSWWLGVKEKLNRALDIEAPYPRRWIDVWWENLPEEEQVLIALGEGKLKAFVIYAESLFEGWDE